MKMKLIKYEFDLKELNNNISYFRGQNGFEPYLIMNTETVDAFRLYVNTMHKYPLWGENIPITKAHENGLVGKYEGNTILIDDELEFGVVDLR